MSEKIFKGFKQVTAEKFKEAKEANALSGYLWFVRTEVANEGTNDVADDKYAIYFGSRQYGYFCEGEIEGIKSSIAELGENVNSILETLETLTSTIETQGEAIAANRTAHEKNAADIITLSNGLAEVLVKNIDSNDKVLNVADGILSAQIGLEYIDGRIILTGKEGNEITGFDASAFVKDSVLDDVEVATKEDGEKYIVFTWKTEGDETKTDEIKVSDFAKLYVAGTGLEISEDGVTFNVKVAENDNFLSINANNELIVDDMTVDKTKIKEDITIEGGPLATQAVKDAFEGGVITAGTDIQTVLKALLCVEIYPETKANTPDYTVSITAPSVTANVENNTLVEVGQKIRFNSVTAKAVNISITNPQVSGFTYGYSDSIDGDINHNNYISGDWTISQAENNVYQLSATKTGFNGSVPKTKQASSANECILDGCELTASEGTNTYKVTEDAPKHTGSHSGVESKYIVSNLGGRKEDRKSPSIASATAEDRDASETTATFTVTGVYPVFTNGVTASTKDETAAAMADLGAHVSGDGTKLALMKANTEFAVSFATHIENVEGYRLYLPGNWKVKSAMAINPNTAKFANNQTSKFVALKDANGETLKVTRTIQNKEVDYTVYEYLASEGPNRVKFTVG